MSDFLYKGNVLPTLFHVQSPSKVPHCSRRIHSRALPAFHLEASGEESASRSFLGTKVPYLKMDSLAAKTLHRTRCESKMSFREVLRGTGFGEGTRTAGWEERGGKISDLTEKSPETAPDYLAGRERQLFRWKKCTDRESRKSSEAI